MRVRDERIEVELDGPLAWITINRPEKHNSFATTMWETLIDSIQLPLVAVELRTAHPVKFVTTRSSVTVF